MEDKVNRVMTRLSDEELMLEYKLGNSEAFEVLYRRHAQKVYGYLASKLRAKTQVDDIFQESFFRLHKFRERYDASFPFLPWLFTICRNVMVDYFRKLSREKDATLQVTKSVDQDMKSPPLNIAEQLEGLSAREGSIVELHFLQGYSFEEVASHLNIEPSNARKISSRAIQKLKAFWK